MLTLSDLFLGDFISVRSTWFPRVQTDYNLRKIPVNEGGWHNVGGVFLAGEGAEEVLDHVLLFKMEMHPTIIHVLRFKMEIQHHPTSRVDNPTQSPVPLT